MRAVVALCMWMVGCRARVDATADPPIVAAPSASSVASSSALPETPPVATVAPAVPDAMPPHTAPLRAKTKLRVLPPVIASSPPPPKRYLHKLDPAGEVTTKPTATEKIVAGGVTLRVSKFEHDEPELHEEDYAVAVMRGANREVFRPLTKHWALDATKRYLHLRGHVGADFHEEVIDLDDGSSIELPHMRCNKFSRWQGDRIVSWSATPLGEYAGDAAIEICVFDRAAHLVGRASTRAAWYVETGTALEVQLAGDALVVGYMEYRGADCSFDVANLPGGKAISIAFVHPSFEPGDCVNYDYDFAGFDFARPSFRARKHGGAKWIAVRP